MKRKMRALAVTLVVAFSLMGAGYAAWSDSIKVDNSITTGNFKVVLHNDTYQPDQGKAEVSAVMFDAKKNPIEDTTEAANPYNKFVKPVKVSDHGVKFAFTNMYPGSKATTMYEIANVGSIPAMIGGINVGITGSTDLQNAVQVHYLIHSDKNAGIKDIEGTVPLLGLKEELTKKLVGTYKLAVQNEPKNDFELDFTKFEFFIPANGLNNVNGQNQGMDSNLEVNVTYDFVQYNQKF